MSDILNSANHILAFTDGLSSFEQYKKDFLIKGAVERHLGIIGEAVNQFRKISTSEELSNARQIVNLRNRIIHAYDNIDDRIIGNIVKLHIRPLKERIEALMG